MPFADSLETPVHSLMASLPLPGVSLNLLTKVQDSSQSGPSTLRGVAVHEWIPVGSLATRTQCRCCHCGVTRTYDLSSEPSVAYARYGETFVKGPMDTTDAPECVAYGRRMPPVVGSRSWDILSWAQP
jgi:hypothetical protein